MGGSSFGFVGNTFKRAEKEVGRAAKKIKNEYNRIEDQAKAEYDRIEDQAKAEYDRFEKKVDTEWDRFTGKYDMEKAKKAQEEAMAAAEREAAIGAAVKDAASMKAGLLAGNKRAEETEKVTSRNARKGRNSLLSSGEEGLGSAAFGLGDTKPLGV